MASIADRYIYRFSCLQSQSRKQNKAWVEPWASNKRFMQGLEIKIDKVLKFRQWCLSYLSLKRKKSSTVLLYVYPAEKQKESIIKFKREWLSSYNVTLSHWSGNLQYQYLNDQVAGLRKSGNKKADWLSYHQAICYSQLAVKSAGFENQNNGCSIAFC